jgi:hypothetical protein
MPTRREPPTIVHPLIQRIARHRLEMLWTWQELGADINARTGTNRIVWNTWRRASSGPVAIHPLTEEVARRYVEALDAGLPKKKRARQPTLFKGAADAVA